MRKGEPQPINSILKEVIERLSAKRQSEQAKIFSKWPALVGRELTRHTQPITLHKGVLKVLVDESVWLYQVNLQKEQLLKMLQNKIGKEKIREIQFRMGNIRKKSRIDK